MEHSTPSMWAAACPGSASRSCAPVLRGKIAHTIPVRISLDETLDIGEDTGTPVVED